MLKRAELRTARDQLLVAKTQLESQKREPRGAVAFLLSPTGVVLLVAALGLVGTALTKFGDFLTARREQETAVILKASDVPMSLPPEQQRELRANNLLWFADNHYIRLSDEVKATLREQAHLTKDQKAQVPVFQTSAAAATAAGAAHYDFPHANRMPVNPKGTTVDVFSCAGQGAQYDSAQRLITELAADADRRRPASGTLLGAIRYDSGQRWRTRNEIWFDPDEKALAENLAQKARDVAGQTFQLVENTEGATPSYLSVYFCG